MPSLVANQIVSIVDAGTHVVLNMGNGIQTALPKNSAIVGIKDSQNEILYIEESSSHDIYEIYRANILTPTNSSLADLFNKLTNLFYAQYASTILGNPSDSTPAIPIVNRPSFSTRYSFSEVIASGVEDVNFDLLKTGTGQTVAQSSGNLVLTSGTTINAETIIRSKQSFLRSFKFKWSHFLSQRIANNNFYIELVDRVIDSANFTLNSTTSITITIPGHTFNATRSIGHGMWISRLTGTDFASQRVTIASISGDNITFTGTGLPASGTGTCYVYGYNFYHTRYTGTTATAADYNTQRRGWQGTPITVACNTTASPGHLATIISRDGQSSAWIDQLTASTAESTVANNTYTNQKASRFLLLPPTDIPLFIQIRVLNGTVAPASNTTWTIESIGYEEDNLTEVQLSAIEPMEYTNPLPVVLQKITGNLPVVGPVAHDGVRGSTAPIITAARAVTANYAAVATGDVADFITTLVGAQIIKPYSIPEADWSYVAAASGISNTTTAVTIRAAQAAGIRNYITGLTISHNTLGGATELVLRDGAAGPVIWRHQLQTTALPLTQITFPCPIKGTAATLLEVVTLTAVSGNVYINVNGYSAP